MQINVHWRGALELRDGARVNLIYTCDLSKLSDQAGVYVFARMHGKRVDPIYIGETLNIRDRIRQHLEKNVLLMKAIESRSTGQRILMTGVLQANKGLQKKKTLVRVQNALIKSALAQGAELTNVHGARTPFDTIHFDGNLKSRTYFGRDINISKK